jgi:hypothetical protein
MSRIQELVRQTEEYLSKCESPREGGSGVVEGSDRKLGIGRAQSMHITVYGRTLDERPFYEEVKALCFNTDGFLFLLSVPVCDGQDLLLINNRTSQEQTCRVSYSCIRDIQTSEVAVTIPSPNPKFWQNSEIPADMDICGV